jgi:hypothetical protein
MDDLWNRPDKGDVGALQVRGKRRGKGENAETARVRLEQFSRGQQANRHWRTRVPTQFPLGFLASPPRSMHPPAKRSNAESDSDRYPGRLEFSFVFETEPQARFAAVALNADTEPTDKVVKSFEHDGATLRCFIRADSLRMARIASNALFESLLVAQDTFKFDAELRS